ncbi:uncharacterized protein [Haliotis asinina]|uniref:uncharacterized protein n=1 Tax=Haliotis asinina TaxID=109174 RepID=UPI0035318CEE
MLGYILLHLLILGVLQASTEPIQLPSFAKLQANYPGYWNFGGRLHNHHLLTMIGTHSNLLLHDTSALRLSYALNKVSGVHSLGKNTIRLSKYGTDSVPGKDGLQYIYHPIAYGPFMADKYGYPTVSKLHQMDPIDTKKNFWGKQGILRVITYTKKLNRPKGHVALWDCNHFHQSKDWIAGHSLITVEFWESPDSNCTNMESKFSSDYLGKPELATLPPNFTTLLKHKSWRKKFIKKFFLEKTKDGKAYYW